jgi:septum site-determining protein MinD
VKAEKGERIDKHLLLTRYDSSRARRGESMTVEAVLEILSLPLLGIILESAEVLRSSNVGAPVTLGSPGSGPAEAYIEAARRLKGEGRGDVIALSAKSGLFGKLFTRRAA